MDSFSAGTVSCGLSAFSGCLSGTGSAGRETGDAEAAAGVVTTGFVFWDAGCEITDGLLAVYGEIYTGLDGCGRT